MKDRIWELDALRGLSVIGMVIIHFVYDLVYLYGIISWEYPTWFSVFSSCVRLVFLLISGICVTLGKHNIRRGLIVFGGGMICTAVTYGMYRFGFAGKSLIIYFGVLHCLGVCMIAWWALKRLPTAVLAVLGILLVVAGLHLRGLTFDCSMWLMPLGFPPKGFSSSDYFPLMPNLGIFLLGAVMGRTVYKNKASLLPGKGELAPVRFLRLCGRQSLWIYLLHQPILSAITYGIPLLVN